LRGIPIIIRQKDTGEFFTITKMLNLIDKSRPDYLAIRLKNGA
jgi:hypothetical protein